jgi:tRNA dimethylallyltransferase
MDKKEKQRLVAVVGPTASGKSRLAVDLAERLGGEILSCDSMQIYCDMDIGTAKPTNAEMRGIKHHLLDFADPHRSFSCADYVNAARGILSELEKQGALPILCGGTGLYLDRLLMGGTAEEATPSEKLREELRAYAEREGKHALHERLRAVDPESAEQIHENNLHRVLRALEIYETTGVPKSAWDQESKAIEPCYDATVIGLRYTNRELLYARINDRVDIMLREGLLEETKRLLDAGVFESNATAAQAIGYKELLAHLRGEETLAEATERLKMATRRYAKRQMTWFGAKNYIQWIDLDCDGKRREDGEILADALSILGVK